MSKRSYDALDAPFRYVASVLTKHKMPERILAQLVKDLSGEMQQFVSKSEEISDKIKAITRKPTETQLAQISVLDAQMKKIMRRSARIMGRMNNVIVNLLSEDDDKPEGQVQK